MKILVALLLLAGAIIAYGSKSIASKILQGKREPNDADIVYVKLVGFAIVLLSAIIMILRRNF